jgi:hypothetical protein
MIKGILPNHIPKEKNGSQSSYIYIFNRFPTNELPKQEIMNKLKETFNLLKTGH